MRKAQFLLIAVLSLLVPFNAIAQSKPQTDGTIIEQSDCPPNTVGTYEQYVEGVKNSYARRIEGSKRDGIKLEMPADFSKLTLSREEFERRKAYKGVDCQRIKYMSDGLKVV